MSTPTATPEGRYASLFKVIRARDRVVRYLRALEDLHDLVVALGAEADDPWVRDIEEDIVRVRLSVAMQELSN